MKYLFLLPLLATQAIAAQDDSRPRVEPKYESTPYYLRAIFGFGPQPNDPIWIVYDGRNLYIDRNGNGDLTDAGEKVVGSETEKGKPQSWWQIGNLGEGTPSIASGGMYESRGRQVVQIHFAATDNKLYSGRNTYPAVTTDPAKSLIINYTGPLTVGLYRPDLAFKKSKEEEFYYVLGTAGRTKHEFASINRDKVPATAYAEMTITFPPKEAGKDPVVKKYTLKSQC
jgi:hypothetical protein